LPPECALMNKQLLIAGGGIGGMALALAASRQGVEVDLLEQASEFSEVGAGIQLGPNAVRVLAEWGLTDALNAVAAFPEALCARDAHSGQVLGRMPLGDRARQRYGQPYATIHRADALSLLVHAVKRQPSVTLHLHDRVRSVWETPEGAGLLTEGGRELEAGALVGCDGLWSVVRRHVMTGPQGLVRGVELPADTPPRFTGHVAYRGMVTQAELPAHLQTMQVTAWLGPRLHVVAYPVRRGALLNVVAVVQGQQAGLPNAWTHEAHHADLVQAMGPVHAELAQVLEQVATWKLWPLNDRPPLTGAYCHAQGKVALAGDAAHPMRPFLAQGAAMALEDAWTLGKLLEQGQSIRPDTTVNWADLFAHYAQVRWRRNAQVQAEAISHGRVYHLSGWLRMARNVSMAMLGERLMDKPWLYDGPPMP